MKTRDVAKNISNVKKEMASLQTNSNDAAQKAMQGHFKLQMRCKLIPPEYRDCTNDYELLTLCGLNDYLNGYTEKLSRANTKEPS